MRSGSGYAVVVHATVSHLPRPISAPTPDYASAYDTTLGPDSSVTEESGPGRSRSRGR